MVAEAPSPTLGSLAQGSCTGKRSSHSVWQGKPVRTLSALPSWAGGGWKPRLPLVEPPHGLACLRIFTWSLVKGVAAQEAQGHG